MSVEARWQQELEVPTGAFFEAFAAQASAPDGLRDGVREAVKALVPRIDWEAYLPHVPHGLLGLRAVLRLRPVLTEGSFLRALAVQLHMAAHEGRRGAQALAQVQAAKGSGSWRNLEAFIRSRRPALAFAEAQGFEAPEAADFQRLGDLAALDMANVGHKAVAADQLGDLHECLEHPKATGRRLLGLAAWIGATAPEDTYWARRAAKRLGEAPVEVPWAPSALPAEGLARQVREICDQGLVALLDGLTARLAAGQPAGDTLAALVLAASEKQLDARRDLEGKTAWTFTYLATLARTRPADPRIWCQAAALVNLFPTDEPEDRVRPEVVEADARALEDAILDAEPARAMGHADALAREGREADVLAVLAEAASRNDPAFNHAHQFLAVAAAADLLPHLPAGARGALLEALAKNLANSQGSGDLGRQADRALGAGGRSAEA